MLFHESKEIYKVIVGLKLSKEDLILNLGSSTKDFRHNIQSHIYREIFSNLQDYKVVHSDIKKEVGVDLVGDITELGFREKLLELKPKIIICSNLLEHVINVEEFKNVLIDILPQDSYLLITTPKDFPYHPDPIDTMFRPTIEELKKVFDRLDFVQGKYVNCGVLYNSCESNRSIRLYNHLKALFRVFMPFYRFSDYIKSFSKFERTSATITLFQKSN